MSTPTATVTTTTTTATPELVLCELERPPLPRHESYSPFCLKVHRALKAAGLAYRSRLGERPDAHRRYNPTGQVPVLLVDGEPVADSTEILRRLARLDPRPTWADHPPAALAESMLWEELADTAVNGFLVAARWADERNWPGVRAAYFEGMPRPLMAVVPALLRRKVVASLVARDVWRAGPDACWRRFTDLLDHLELRAPARGFWLGERLGPADLGLFAQMHSLRLPLTAWQSQQIAARPRLSAWLDRVDAATCPP